MELSALSTLLSVMRRGSFAAAARERAQDPSAVSRTIRALEHELGVRLFHRTTRRLAPTEAARALAAQVEPSVAQILEATSRVAERGAEATGLLRITAPVTFAQINLAPLLPELAARHPTLSFELLLTDRRIDLVEEGVDVAIRLGRLADSSLISHRLCDMVYAVAASPDYLRRCGTPYAPAELAEHACLRYPVPGYGARWRFQRGRGPVVEVPVRSRVTAANGVALRQCAVAGMGVVLLPRWNIADELRSGALVQVLGDYQASVSELGGAAWLLYPSRRHVPAKVRVFVELLRARFRGGAPVERDLPAPITGRRRR